jgi:organic radical activating enzyme
MSNVQGFLQELFTSIQGEGTWIGHRQIFLRLAGCRETCAFCDTPQSRPPRPKSWQVQFPNIASVPLSMANPVTAPEVVPLLWNFWLTYGPFHSLAITGGEPLEQADYLKALLQELRRQRWPSPILLETNGHLPLGIKKVKRHLDFISADIKLKSACGKPTAWDQHEAFLRHARSVDGCVKVVVVPKTSAVEIVQAARLIRQCVPRWDFIIQPATGVAWKKTPARLQLEALLQAAAHVHPAVRLIPQIHPMLGWA